MNRNNSFWVDLTPFKTSPWLNQGIGTLRRKTLSRIISNNAVQGFDIELHFDVLHYQYVLFLLVNQS